MIKIPHEYLGNAYVNTIYQFFIYSYVLGVYYVAHKVNTCKGFHIKLSNKMGSHRFLYSLVL